MTTFITSNGDLFDVDPEDAHLVEKYAWNTDRYGYIRRRDGRTGKTIMLQNEILPKREGHTVDHIDRDPTNNRRSNLRYATPKQQLQNRGFKGVSQIYNGKWQARIVIDGKRKQLGCFSTREEAEEAYRVEFEKRNDW